jgi:hypothetical protein
VLDPTVLTGEFAEVLALIEAARRRAYQAVNTELEGLYWQLGEYISNKIESAQWGDGWSRSWPPSSPAGIQGCAGSRGATCFACGSSTTLTEATRKCHRW